MNNNNNRKDVKDRIFEAAEKIEKCISIFNENFGPIGEPNPSADMVKFLLRYFIKKCRNKPS